MPRACYEIKAMFGLTKRGGVSRRKRFAIRRCRAMTSRLGPGASGEVRREGFGLVFQCHAIEQNGRVVIRVDEL
jgi:hypothetical protein